MLVRIVAVQACLGEPLSLEEKIHIFKQRPDYVCLPEYYLLDRSVSDYSRAALRVTEYLDYFEKLSDQLTTCLIAGTIVEPDGKHLYNSCYLYNRGFVIGRYRKRCPVSGEQEKGISPGSEKLVLNVDGVRISVLICGDVFNQDLFTELASEQVDLVFVPTTSPYLPDDSLSRKAHRDRKYFISGAELARSYVIKVCGVGEIFGRPLQGRSLVTAPWGIISRTEIAGEQKKRILSLTLDINELREFRAKLRIRDWVDQTGSESDRLN
ncbi:MAG: carbon-nitrogen hydrolase family protein [Candidatus Zixiibacteriota bacterium]|nr:MAG: carbon-nitrogen hydrolase family protein [candidate division Zixibacteria bacterium]